MSWASRHNLLARAVNRNLGGVPVNWGAVSGEALLEQNTEMVLDGQVLSVEYALHNLRADLFGGMNYGDAVTVAGEIYEVRHAPLLVGDGRFCVVMLEKLPVTPPVEPVLLPLSEQPAETTVTPPWAVG